VAEEEVEPPSPLVTTVDGDRSGRNAFITGIAKMDNQLIILLDLVKVLNTEEQAELETLQRVQDNPTPGKV
jgi:chemotaxis signal transduction protein